MKQYVSIKDFEYQLGSRQLNALDIGQAYITDQMPAQKIEHFISDIIGRECIYEFDTKEQPIDLCIALAKKVIRKNGLSTSDIDGIICTSNIPEYYAPTTALIMHGALGLRSDLNMVMDVNMDCTGILSTIYLVNNAMAIDKTIKNVLVMDISLMRHVRDKADLLTDAGSSDSVSVLLLEKKTSPTEMYIQNIQDTTDMMSVVGPRRGMYHFMQTGDYKDFILGMNENVNCSMDALIVKMKNFFNTFGIDKQKIAFNCFSQCTKRNLNFVCQQLELAPEKTPYISSQIGYTGPSSPLIALMYGVKEGKVHRGDNIFFWTLAVGTQHILVHMTY